MGGERFFVSKHQHVLDAARHLLKHGFEPDAVLTALGMVGKGAGVDRVYIFENSPDLTTASQRFEWSGGAPAQLDNPELQDMPWAVIAPTWPAILGADQTIGGLVSSMPSPGRALLEAQGILSILVCPVLVDGRLWGMVGFDDCHSERVWPDDEVTLLRGFARALSGAMRHHANRERLEQARAQLRAILGT